MKLAERFLRKNFILLIISLDIFYVVVFYIFYLLGLKQELSLNSVLDVTYNNPTLILILVHPVFLSIFLTLNSRENIKYYENLESLINSQQKKIEEVGVFVEELRQGKNVMTFSQEFQQDKLVRALLNMRDDIEKTRKEDQQRQIEEKQRHWVNEGLAKFGAILRENVDNLEKLSSEITSNLTKYLDCQQAGFFIVKEQQGEKFLEMIALFAYDRKKFPDKKFNWGEGLIGACAIELKTIFLKETSDSFVDITSGLGKANPRSVLIAPIKDSESVVHGVIELASFKVFEDFEISFIEQVAESIGLTIATIKTGLRTQELLKESQKQAEMLAQQDETMRRNIEEIEKQREESEHRALEFEIFSDSVNKAVIRVDIDLIGNINFVNNEFLEVFQFDSKESVIGQKFSNLIETDEKLEFNSIFQYIIEKGERYNTTLHMLNSADKLIWIVASFVPIFNSQKELSTIMFLAVDRTETRNILNENSQQINAFNNIVIKVDFNTDGSFISANKQFNKTFGYEQEELTDLKVFDIIPDNQVENFRNIWNNLLKGKDLQATQEFVTNNKQTIVAEVFTTVIKDLNKVITKVTLFALDITQKIDIQEKLKIFDKKNKEAQEEIYKLTKESVKQLEKAKQEIAKQYKEKEAKANLYENLFQSFDHGLVVFQNDFIVVFNNEAEKIWGLKRDITIGKKTRYLFAENDNTKEDSDYLGNIVLKGVTKSLDEKQLYILNRDMKKIEVFAKITFFSYEDSQFIAIFLKQI